MSIPTRIEERLSKVEEDVHGLRASMEAFNSKLDLVISQLGNKEVETAIKPKPGAKTIVQTQIACLDFPQFSRDDPTCTSTDEALSKDDALSKLQQIGTVREYKVNFEKLATHVNGWPEKVLLASFVKGLKEEIRHYVKIFKPTTVLAAIGLAQMQEEKLQKQQQNVNHIGYKERESLTKPIISEEDVEVMIQTDSDGEYFEPLMINIHGEQALLLSGTVTQADILIPHRGTRREYNNDIIASDTIDASVSKTDEISVEKEQSKICPPIFSQLEKEILILAPHDRMIDRIKNWKEEPGGGLMNDVFRWYTMVADGNKLDNKENSMQEQLGEPYQIRAGLNLEDKVHLEDGWNDRVSAAWVSAALFYLQF